MVGGLVDLVSEPVRLVLPIPPSTNNLYRGGPRYKTSEYRGWTSAAVGDLIVQGRIGFMLPKGRYRIDIAAPFSRRRDLDNVKAVMDLLVSAGILPNDNMVDDLRVRRIPVGEELVVTIEAMEGSDATTDSAITDKRVAHARGRGLRRPPEPVGKSVQGRHLPHS